MTEHQQQRPNLIYTPHCHIPIGEPVRTADGTRALKFKKAGGKDTEVVTIEALIAMMVHATDKSQ